jgi:hypothetical protein
VKKRLVNLGRSDENIAEQYPNIYEGLQKDAGQNSWDARLFKKGKDWKLLFKYLPEHNSVVIEDFGTTGMDDARWNSYQNLWDTSKTESELGARGQGKFLFHYFSSEKLVLTETIDGSNTYRFSYGNNEEWADDKSLGDFIRQATALDHRGTRVWIMDVRKEFLNELLDSKKFQRYIETTWWEIIRDYDATFLVNFDGVPTKVVISDPPAVSKVAQFRNEKIADIGSVRNLEVYYTKADVPDDLRGIAVERGGMTIARIPVAADESLRTRIYGYVNFDEDLERELKKCELPNHFGFSNRKAWNHVREYVRRKLETFILEISPPKKKIEVSSNVLDEAVKLVNNLVEQYAPELLVGPPAKGGRKQGGSGGGKPREKPPIRIDVFRPNEKRFDYNETLIVDCELVNETGQDKQVVVEIRVTHESGKEKHSSAHCALLSGRSRQRIDAPLIDFEVDDAAGRYFAEAVLKTGNPGEELDTRGFTVWLEQEPPERGRAFVTGFRMIKGKTAENKTLFFSKWRNLEINEQGIIHVIWDHPDFERERARSSTKRGLNQDILVYCAQRGIDEVLRRLLGNRLAEERLDSNEIKKIKNLCEEMIHDAVVSAG